MATPQNPFSPDSIASAVHSTLDAALASIPDNKRGALLVLAGPEGMQVMAAARIGNNWQLAAGAGKPWDGPLTAHVAVAGSW